MSLRTGSPVLGGVASATFLPPVPHSQLPGFQNGCEGGKVMGDKKGLLHVAIKVAKMKHVSVCSFNREE